MNIFKYGMINHPRFWLRNIGQFFHNIRYAWQRAVRGFSDPDWWELDSYLSKIISGCLKEFDKKRIGIPSELYFQLGEEDGNKKWSEILLKIAENMERYEKAKTENKRKSEKLWNDAFDLLKKWHENMWD